MAPDPCSPACLIGKPLFEPIEHLLRGFDGPLPDAAGLNAFLDGMREPPRTGQGRPLRFADPVKDGRGYEERIAHSGEVEHRPDNWHDFFNALVWLAFPRSKAALSQRHARELDERRGAGMAVRGRVRDALTQFDECGVVVLSSDPSILELLRHHDWREAFWRRRAELSAGTRFIVFGHASYDHLRAPFFGLCGKAVYLEVEPSWLARDAAAQRADVDARLADWLLWGLKGTKDLKPLPLLGIPGVVPASESEAYYDDVRQFRPLRRQ